MSSPTHVTSTSIHTSRHKLCGSDFVDTNHLGWVWHTHNTERVETNARLCVSRFLPCLVCGLPKITPNYNAVLCPLRHEASAIYIVWCVSMCMCEKSEDMSSLFEINVLIWIDVCLRWEPGESLYLMRMSSREPRAKHSSSTCVEPCVVGTKRRRRQRRHSSRRVSEDITSWR